MMEFLLCLIASFHVFPLAVTESPTLRLTGGLSPCAGRVEVYHQNEWGTVCDDDWDIKDAQVVCRVLNCGTAIRAPGTAAFGQGFGRIWLHLVQCSGTETSLKQCQHPQWGKHNCRHDEDASVVCSAATTSLGEPTQSVMLQDKKESEETEQIQSTISPKETPALRLAGGLSPCAGRVEVNHQNEWGTVCDDDWDIKDAQVVCRELKCGTAIRAPGTAAFGQGSGRIWIHLVKCRGTETSLKQCQHPQWGKHNCRHEEDASVVCSAATTSPGEPTQSVILQDKKESEETEQIQTTISPKESTVLTLANGPSRCAGRVEVFHQDKWGTVCDDFWGLTNAQVVCRELGCGDALSAPGGAFFGEGKGVIWLDNVECTGKESSLLHCAAAPMGKHNCQHAEDAGVVCSENRSVSPPVESHDPSIAGQRDITTPTQISRFPTSPQPHITVKPTEPKQKQSESTTESEQRFDALLPPIKTELLPQPPLPRPEHTEETYTDTFGIRLAGGPDRCSGRVEVYHDQQWGTVCKDGWNVLDAQVVCQEMGCGSVVAFSISFGPGLGPIWTDAFSCYGYEAKLSQCNTERWGLHDCDHKKDVGIICNAPSMKQPTPSTVSQQSSSVPDGWTIFNRVQQTAFEKLSQSSPLPSTTPLVDQATEHSTSELQSTQNSETTVTTTSPSLEHLWIRLVDGPNRCAGRVEVYHDQQWGTVCDDGWGMLDAQVVCRELHCGKVLSFSKMYGQGSGPIWKDEVSCYGFESSLMQCNSEQWGDNDCDHSEDAGVQCEEIMIEEEKPENSTNHSIFQAQTSEQVIKGQTFPIPEDSSRLETPQVTCPKVDSVCHPSIPACEAQHLPELVEIMREMRNDFSSITRLLQQDQHHLENISRNLHNLASSLRQLVNLVPVQEKS